ncbi:MAG: hypothetical protein J7L88_01195, partial [Thermoplasmata archaeon]|nr:hypothetical protein [Thermoplasmata archaeon]
GEEMGEERYLLYPSGRIERLNWGGVVEELIFSGVSYEEAVKGVRTALKNLPGEKYIPAGYLFWELKQILDKMDPTGRLSTKYAFYKEPEIYLTLEKDGRRYPVTRELLTEEVLKRLPRGKYVCGSDVVENVVEHLYSVIRHINMETVPTSFFQEDQEIPISGDELDRIVENFVRRYLPYYEETRSLEPSQAALGVLKGTMHYFHRSEVLLESDPETSLKYLLKAFKTLVEAELLASGVQPTFSFSRNMRMLRSLHDRRGEGERVKSLYEDVLHLYRRFKRKRTILERDEDLIARGQSRAKEVELLLKGVSGTSEQRPYDPSDRV